MRPAIALAALLLTASGAAARSPAPTLRIVFASARRAPACLRRFRRDLHCRPRRTRAAARLARGGCFRVVSGRRLDRRHRRSTDRGRLTRRSRAHDLQERTRRRPHDGRLAAPARQRAASSAGGDPTRCRGNGERAPRSLPDQEPHRHTSSARDLAISARDFLPISQMTGTMRPSSKAMAMPM